MKDKFLTARYKSKCSETGKQINKGEQIYYNGRTYCSVSQAYLNALECLNTRSYIEAHESAMFERYEEQIREIY